jgi:hypothetical protein
MDCSLQAQLDAKIYCLKSVLSWPPVSPDNVNIVRSAPQAKRAVEREPMLTGQHRIPQRADLVHAGSTQSEKVEV